MPIKDSNITAINAVWNDDMEEAPENKENDLDQNSELFKSGPRLQVQVSLDRNQVTVEFPTLYKVDKDGERTQAISITVDYFNDMIRIFHNDEEMLLEIPWDESKQVMVVPSVKKLISERGV